MKLSFKISIIILVLSLLSISIIGVISYVKGKEALELAIKQEAYLLAIEKMNTIDRYIYDEVQDLKFFVTSPVLREAILAKNAELEGEDVESILTQTDAEWRSTPKNETSPLMRSILEGQASSKLRQRKEFFRNQSNFDVYSEMFLTDKYGGVVAMTGRTSDYRQDDEEWWQRAKRDGSFVGDVGYDESAGVYSIDLAVPVEDKDGNFIGVVKSVMDISQILSLIDASSESLTTLAPTTLGTSYKLLNKEGKVIYAIDNFTIFEDVSAYLEEDFDTPAVEQHVIGSKTLHGEGVEELVLHAPSDGFKEFEGLGWALLMEVRSKEFYQNVMQFQTMVLIIVAAVSLVVALSSIWLSRTISQPFLRLEYAMMHARSGNFDIPVDVKRRDEIGNLAQSFDIMRTELQKTHAKLKEHEQELEQKVQQRTQELNEKIAEAEQSKVAVLNIIEDIHDTNRQLLETQEKLKSNIEDLRKLDTQKDQFISIAAHELKTPLTSIKGFSDLLRKESIVENKGLRDKYLGIIFDDTERLGKLITNILELSRMDIGTLKLAWENLSPEKLMREVKEQMEVIIKGKGLKSEFILEENLPSIMLDKDKTVQVLSNLINNAVHYTEKGQITVSVKRKEEDILFSVADTGEGIPKEVQGKIFTRFYQVDSPLTRKIGGTGLGLSLSKGFVEAMGGRMWFESDYGKGTTFYFTLPIVNERTKQKDVSILPNNADREGTANGHASNGSANNGSAPVGGNSNKDGTGG
jgi:signal transduction histidine kinase